MKMKDRNAQLKSALGAMASKETVLEVASIPKEDTRNRQGYKAYSLDDELRLVTMLNTLKITPQFYRTESQTMAELRDLIERIASKDPYFVAQAIAYSRCLGEGMRSINHLAAALVSPFIAGQEYAKRFYGLFDKKNGKGGCIFRPDDMTEIKDVYSTLTKSVLSNAMKKGFASALENLDTYSLAKYRDTVIDIANLSHPNPSKSKATVKMNGEVINVLNAIMTGVTISADTWENANSEAGREVAKALKDGKITKAEAETILAEAKADNWESLLKDGRLGVMAALRNIRNILKNPRKGIIEDWCKLITNPEIVHKALILPCHFDLAYEVVMNEFANVDYSPKVQQALMDGYVAAIPNLKEALPGRTAVIVDCSGSMGSYGITDGKTAPKDGYGYYGSYRATRATNSCAYKAGLIAATIAKATGADVIKFGSEAKRFSYNKNENVFSLAKKIGTSEYGCTYPSRAFDLIRQEKSVYDRIIFISDNEVNSHNLTSDSYRKYIHDVCSPYIYCVDLAAYGTTPLKSDKVSYYYGYGSMLYDDIAAQEFNAAKHIDKIRQYVI